MNNKNKITLLHRILNNTTYHKYREIFLMTSDLGVISLAYFISILLKYDFKLRTLIALIDIYYKLIPVFFITHIFWFLIFKIHKSLWKYFGVSEIINVTFAVIFTTGSILIFTLIYLQNPTLSTTVVIAEAFGWIGLLNVRFIYRLYRDKALGYKGHKKRAVIIGAGDGGYILLKELQQNDKLKVEIVGFIDDYKNKKVISGVKVLGTTDDLKNIVEKRGVEIAYIAMPSSDFVERKRIFDICQEIKLEVKIMRENSNFFKLTNSNSETTNKYPLEDVSISDLLERGQVNLSVKEIEENLFDKTILITGAAGSIGSELCRQIIKFNPRHLIMVDINENGLYMLEHELRRNNAVLLVERDLKISSYVASIRDYQEITEIFKTEEPDVVYHAAAHKHVPLMETRPQEAIKNNVFGSKNVIMACIENKISRFVLISTDKAVNPTNVMGATKRLTEMILQAYGNNGVTKMGAVRFGNVLGSNGSVIPIFNEQIKNGGPVTLTHRDITRYFMSIPEAAQLVLQAGSYAKNGEIFVLDMGDPVKIIDLAEKLIKLSGYEPYTEIDILETGLRPGEKMFEELSLDDEIVNKTENSLIFVNKPMEIEIEFISEIMSDLQKLLDEKANPKVIKEKLLKVIK